VWGDSRNRRAGEFSAAKTARFTLLKSTYVDFIMSRPLRKYIQSPGTDSRPSSANEQDRSFQVDRHGRL